MSGPRRLNVESDPAAEEAVVMTADGRCFRKPLSWWWSYVVFDAATQGEMRRRARLGEGPPPRSFRQRAGRWLLALQTRSFGFCCLEVLLLQSVLLLAAALLIPPLVRQCAALAPLLAAGPPTPPPTLTNGTLAPPPPPSLSPPLPLARALLGAVAYDGLDGQWSAYVAGLPALLALSLGIAAAVGAALSTAEGHRDGTAATDGEHWARQLRRRLCHCCPWRLHHHNGLGRSSTRAAARQESADEAGDAIVNDAEKSHAASLPLLVAAPSVDARAHRVACVYAASGVGMLLVLHGPQSLLVFAILLAHYGLTVWMQGPFPGAADGGLRFSGAGASASYRATARAAGMAGQWFGMIALMVLSNHYHGGELLEWARPFVFAGRRGMLWWVPAIRLSVLRMLAFAYDRAEALGECEQQAAAVTGAGSSAVPLPSQLARTRQQQQCSECRSHTLAYSGGQGADSRQDLEEERCWCYRCRSRLPRPACDYSLLHYVAYVTFAPLYIAGPIVSFNAFCSFLRHPSAASLPAILSSVRGTSRARLALLLPLLWYAARCVVIYLCGTVLLSLVFVCSLSRSASLLAAQPLTMRLLHGYFYLAFLWLKFALLWRTSRLMALLAGVDPPENMRRCFTNTVSVRLFWRDWHASFNLWIVRYMYIPMGGRRRRLLSVGPIFLFVALWHDHGLHLLVWALGIAAVFVAEVLGAAAYDRLWPLPPAVTDASPALPPATRLARRLASSAGSVLSVFALIAVNLIGFNVQKDGWTDATAGARSRTARSIWRVLCEVPPATAATVVALVLSSCVLGIARRQWEEAAAANTFAADEGGQKVWESTVATTSCAETHPPPSPRENE